MPDDSRNEPLTIESTDGVRLEAQIDWPADPQLLFVFCHPHPQHGGTMRAPLIEKMVPVLLGSGVAVLRFNFRGVGDSTGEWERGVGEIDDVGAAVNTARGLGSGLKVSLGGWSFGAATSLVWQTKFHEPMPWVGIAPPVSSTRTPDLPEPDAVPPARRLFILGDRDQFVTVDDLTGYAESIDAEIQVLSGSDHFFYFREETVAEQMANFLIS